MENELNIALNQPIDLIVIVVKKAAIRCRILKTGKFITFRKTTSMYSEVEGEILTVKPSKVWIFRKNYYVTGDIISKRLDIPALQFKPLMLNSMGKWNPEDEYWGEPDEPINLYFKPIIDFGTRESFEMEQIIPCADIENMVDPIIDASEYYEQGDYDKAYKIIENILITDLRCLDAHAHLGNWDFNHTDKSNLQIIDKAKRHYEAGVKIGELSLGEEFNGVLPWGHIDNRPFLRCLHGYGLSLWRLGDNKTAKKIFEKMLWLNPADNQGVRFLLEDIDAGRSWYDLKE
ncbi:hypothetical protein HY745_01410 [Candidatus Desantisbacteria bacterium]|nr:hypothetical protein [Candidatus Desantisbacteria bacterium]